MDFLEEIDAKMSAIEYGWVDNANNRHTDLTDFGNSYKLQSPEQLLKSRLGVCWDQVELERKLFTDAKIATRSFFIVHYDDDKCPTHTFILFEYNNKIYWYEHAWSIMRGLHVFDNFNQAISDIRSIFIEKELQNNYNPQNLMIYEYEAPPSGLSCPDFYKHCENGKQIQISNL